ncbi:ACP S-malonyltransferase [Chengkuizengella axinellae]|uniref:Malonyl CoA-acyl carrier protein transacylase n=1 Tax=Chengkuizengella axinellae TaxID=3064388 RepID=A0ABT9IX71_9BACL|nr:ACP S-malonyltransferase [Chengkuizengella sp. 2205SS18-9]MDP5273404.1 ACP S-malonyltransferase [Chengkuizengella sp. 2205SS18-9]
MGKVAFVFPGQGAQVVGMGLDVYEQHASAKSIFNKADEILDFKLSDLVFQGPEDQLKLTYNTQPALLTTSIALYEVFKEAGLTPDFVAGHSLGEYSALVAAGVMSFEDAVRIVRLRGEFMDQAVPEGKGSMAAVLGLERDKLEELCKEVSHDVGLVEMANVNCPGQIVISGTSEGIQAIVERGKEVGAKRVLPLEVSGPFHSTLMKTAADKLSKELDGIQLNSPEFPVVANVTASAVAEASEIKKLLVDQVCAPVLWEASILYLLEQGVDTFIEIGSGKVLSGLIKKINRKVKVISIQDMKSIDGFKMEGLHA